MRNGSTAGTATSSPTKTELIRNRLLAGEELDSLSVVAEYEVDRSMFTHLVRELKKQGHIFSETKTTSTAPTKYRLAKVSDPRNKHQSPRQQSAGVVPVDVRTDYEKVSEALIAGDRLRGADLSVQGMKPQLLSVTIAQLKAAGYLFDHEDTEDGKVWFVTGKGEPQPRKKRRSTGVPPSEGSGSRSKAGGSKSRPKMPAPELDAPTEVILVHRISPDEVEVAFRQGSRQWLVAVRSCIED